jgi:hypothetical protein
MKFTIFLGVAKYLLMPHYNLISDKNDWVSDSKHLSWVCPRTMCVNSIHVQLQNQLGTLKTLPAAHQKRSPFLLPLTAVVVKTPTAVFCKSNSLRKKFELNKYSGAATKYSSSQLHEFIPRTKA